MSKKCYLGIKRYIGESFYLYVNGKYIEIKVNEKHGQQIELLVIAERDVIIARDTQMLAGMITKQAEKIAHI